jgi:hypothetical protein
MSKLIAIFFWPPDYDGNKVKFVKKTIKFLAVAFLCAVLAFGGCAYFFAPHPPKEAKLVQNFNEHRATFEKLRGMLQADTNLTRIASWGVETRNPVFLGSPPGGNFPTERFNEYLALLKEAGGLLASRDEGVDSDPSIVIWAWGWAGDTKHIGICWLDKEPTNQITTFDGYKGRSVYPDRAVVFKRVDRNWYLWNDW